MARPRKPDEEVTASALRQRERRKNQDEERSRQVNKRSWATLRLECLRHYSGFDVPKCRCCGETIFEFLHLDHGFGNGAEHRRQLKAIGIDGGTGFYCWLKKNGWPDDLGLQVLCSNCDFGKKTGQCCPHENSPVTPIEDLLYRRSISTTKQLENESRQAYQKRYRSENKERIAALKKRAMDAVRLECLQHYSGLEMPSCRCCGETIIEFLQLDHIDGNGAEYKKFMVNRNGTNLFGNAMHYHLKNSEWPNEPRLQVLCVNCNFGKRIGKYCPHELLNHKDMDGTPIPDEFYPTKLNWMPITKSPERVAWLESPEGLTFKQKQSETHLGKMVGKDHPNWTGGPVDVSCTECGASLKRKQCELQKRGKEQTRFFCNMKCSGAWKKKNLVGDKIYNTKPSLEFECPNCQTKLFRKQHQLRPGQTQVFCNKKCADAFKIGKPTWNKGKSITA